MTLFGHLFVADTAVRALAAIAAVPMVMMLSCGFLLAHRYCRMINTPCWPI